MKKILYLVLTAALLTSCYKDKSSDNYTPIGTISVTGIEAEYRRISYAEKLEIAAKVTSTDPADKFSYVWTIFDSSQALGTSKPDTIATTQALNYDINVSPSTYTVTLCVTNEANNYKQFFSTKLITGTPFTTGHYLLKQTADGKTDIDFRNPKGEMLNNLMEQHLGGSMSGTPLRISIAKEYGHINPTSAAIEMGTVIMATSTEDCNVMSLNDISLIYNHKNMFYGDVPQETPYFAIGIFFGYSAYVSSAGIYSSSSGKHGYPVKPEGNIKLSRHMIMMPGFSQFTSSLYDEIGGRFIKTDYNNYLQEHVDNNGNASSGITHKLLYMGPRNTWSMNGYAIFQDINVPTTRYIYTLESATTNSISNIETIDPSLNFNRATLYTTNKESQIIYGVVDGTKIYMYNNGTKSEMLLQPEGMATDEEITMITNKNGLGKTLLHIATHKAGKYKVYMYNLSGGAPYGAPEITATGDGKVVDIQHTGTSEGYINL